MNIPEQNIDGPSVAWPPHSTSNFLFSSPSPAHSFSPPPQTPAPRPLSTPAPQPITSVISPRFVDRLANDFKLEPQQRTDLHTFVQLGSLGEGLSQADLATRIYIVAILHGQTAERKRAASEQGVGDLAGLFNDLKIRLDETFSFTKEQRGNIRGAAQDLIFQATRTAFVTMHIDLDRALREDKVSMKLTNVFGSPSREKMLASLIRKTCSSVRNSFRQDLRASICDETACSLSEFTYASATKYKTGGPGLNLEIGFTIHNALLRRFAVDNTSLLGVEEHEDDEEDIDLDDTNPSSRPTKKRKRSGQTHAGGRIAKGQDFWSQVDAFFVRMVSSFNSRNLTGPAWRDYVDQVLRNDDFLFPDPNKAQNTVVPTGQADNQILPVAQSTAATSTTVVAGAVNSSLLALV
ncbi:hypothetical protein Hypma_012041 [Hypsizygus marmoreus]|uniref:Uncharacterized protein n=1 Tax=Hypsizygus marmoreus TaxID=39966 RepID=A0A369JFE6_HYPMA|nr:hypothetical protein Hypma_012041 [Hypsizygus marmoreus]